MLKKKTLFNIPFKLCLFPDISAYATRVKLSKKKKKRSKTLKLH